MAGQERSLGCCSPYLSSPVIGAMAAPATAPWAAPPTAASAPPGSRAAAVRAAFALRARPPMVSPSACRGDLPGFGGGVAVGYPGGASTIEPIFRPPFV